MEPKLDRSVPKDQIRMVLIAMVVGMTVGVLALIYSSGRSRVVGDGFTIAYAAMGAFVGAMGMGFPKSFRGWLRILLGAVTALFLIERLPGTRGIVTVFVFSWAGAFVVSSLYHAVKAARDA